MSRPIVDCKDEPCQTRRAFVAKKFYMWLKIEIQKLDEKSASLKNRRYRLAIRYVKYPNKAGVEAWMELYRDGFYEFLGEELDEFADIDEVLNWTQEKNDIVQCTNIKHTLT